MLRFSLTVPFTQLPEMDCVVRRRLHSSNVGFGCFVVCHGYRTPVRPTCPPAGVERIGSEEPGVCNEHPTAIDVCVLRGAPLLVLTQSSSWPIWSSRPEVESELAHCLPRPASNAAWGRWADSCQVRWVGIRDQSPVGPCRGFFNDDHQLAGMNRVEELRDGCQVQFPQPSMGRLLCRNQ